MGDEDRPEASTSSAAQSLKSPEDSAAPPELTEREVYFKSLRLWVQQAHMYQNFSTCFPYYMMTFQNLQSNPGAPNAPLLNNNYQIQGQQWPFQFPYNPHRNVPENRPADDTLSPAEVIARHGGYEYVVPPLYKRLIAEFIDFILLFIVKLLVTFIAVDMLEIIDLDKFDLYKLSENLDDLQLAIELTSEILLLELMYRVLVCLFEAWCLSEVGGGGATPGKVLLGLRVVSARAVLAVPGRARDSVLVHPARPLPFTTSLGRSFLKNMLISLLFPLCFVLFLFRHNRTGYDLLCHVIVVEENMFPPRRNAVQ